MSNTLTVGGDWGVFAVRNTCCRDENTCPDRQVMWTAATRAQLFYYIFELV